MDSSLAIQVLRLARLGLALAVAWLAALDLRAAETFERLAARIPSTANVLVLIDVEQTMASPLAREQGWAQKLEAAYVERPVYLPPEAKKLVLGASLRPTDDFANIWEAAVIELAEPVGVRSIARSESGYVDEVNGVRAAITPLDAGFLELDFNLLGVVHPADRQFMSRWAAAMREGSSPTLSAYLQSAVKLVSDRAQVLLAVDLSDVLSPHDVEARLADATWIEASNIDRKDLVPVLTKLRGAALRLAIGKRCRGRLQVDFDADVEPLKKIAQPLVLEALANLGVSTAELADWRVSFADRSIHMEGDLSTDAQRRVFSIIELPSVELKPGEASAGNASPGEVTVSSSAEPSDGEVAKRSQAYFKSTQILVADLRRGLKDTKATSAWMERYAKRIDDLPVLHVDELLLDYGDKLAETLRVMSLSKRQAGIRYGVRATEGGSSYFDGYNYGTDAYSQAAGRSQAKKEEMAVASDTRVQGWKLIDDASADIRRTLTQKYGVEF